MSSFWVDQECIDQTDERAKALAIQSMETVYRRSHIRPLSTLLTRQKHVNHLRQLLEGSSVQEIGQFPSHMRLGVSFSKARKARWRCKQSCATHGGHVDGSFRKNVVPREEWSFLSRYNQGSRILMDFMRLVSLLHTSSSFAYILCIMSSSVC